MIKSIITALCATILLVACALYENNYIESTFGTFYEFIQQVDKKIQDGNCTQLDGIALRDFWLDKKEYLHIWIPHNDIKEIDLWVSETVVYLKQGNFKEASAKLEVIGNLSQQIPRTFSLKLENLF